MVTRTRLNVTLYVHCLCCCTRRYTHTERSCCLVVSRVESSVLWMEAGIRTLVSDWCECLSMWKPQISWQGSVWPHCKIVSYPGPIWTKIQLSPTNSNVCSQCQILWKRWKMRIDRCVFLLCSVMFLLCSANHEAGEVEVLGELARRETVWFLFAFVFTSL